MSEERQMHLQHHMGTGFCICLAYSIQVVHNLFWSKFTWVIDVVYTNEYKYEQYTFFSF